MSTELCSPSPAQGGQRHARTHPGQGGRVHGEPPAGSREGPQGGTLDLKSFQDDTLTCAPRSPVPLECVAVKASGHLLLQVAVLGVRGSFSCPAPPSLATHWTKRQAERRANGKKTENDPAGMCQTSGWMLCLPYLPVA